MAHYKYSRASNRGLLSPDWRVKDEIFPASLRTPINRGWRPREASNRIHVDENDPAIIPGKTMNGNSTKTEHDLRVDRAIEERRSIRVGNLSFKATKQDLLDFFAREGYAVEHVKMCTDPITGAIKPYCFVALTTKDLADGALRNLHGAEILGRSIRVELGVSGLNRREANNGSAKSNSNSKSHVEPTPQRQKRTNTVNNQGYNKKARRLIVLGLPQLLSFDGFEKQVRDLFQDFKVSHVHEVAVPPVTNTRDENRRNDPFVYVDFCSADEAKHAKFAKNGAQAWGRTIQVKYLKSFAARRRDTHQLRF